MKKFLLPFVLIIGGQLISNAQQFTWVAPFGGNGYDVSEETAIDNAGNIYTVGIFTGTCDFDPGSGSYPLTSNGAQDIYILKLDSNKNFLWAKQIGGTQQDFAYSISVSTSGEVFIAGSFKTTVDFDPGLGMNNVTSAGADDIFVLKLTSAGNFTWVKTIGSTGSDNAERCRVDQNGNIIVCGLFSGTVDFDPGIGTQSLISVGSQDAYVWKLDAGGGYQWAGRFGSTGGEFAQGLWVDGSGNVFVTGEFYGTVDFDPSVNATTLTAAGSNADGYVLKWSSLGAFIWVDQITGPGNEQGYSITTDNLGKVVVCGSYSGMADFDPGIGTSNLTSAGMDDAFVLKLSSSGAFVFADDIGGTQLDAGRGIITSPSGDIYLTGLFSGTADFDPDTTTFNLTSTGPGDIFVLELNSAGHFKAAGNIGGTDTDFGTSVNIYGTDEAYFTGTFAYVADFDPGPGVENDTSYLTTNDAFILKLSFCQPAQTSVSVNLCPGDSVFAGGAYQTQPGTYYDYYNAANGCDSIVTTTVTYPFTVNLGADIVGCDGSTIQLSAGVNNATYLWNTGDVTQNISVTQSGLYSVSVTQGGCTISDAILITLHASPTVNLGSDTALCGGNSVTLDAGINPGSSFLWSTGATTQTINVSAAGTYSVTAINSFTCSASDEVVVTVTTSLNVNLGGNASFCQGDSIVLNAGNSGATYVWSNGASTQSITVTSAGTYGVTVTSASGCTGTDNAVITVNPIPPQPTISVAGNVLTSSAATGNQWFMDGSSIGGATGMTYTITQDGYYQVEETDANGCSSMSDSTQAFFVGINEIAAKHNLTLYPNPANDFVILSNDFNATELIILNSLGQTILDENNLTGSAVRVDVKNYTGGIYFVELKNSDGTYLAKLVIQR